MGKKVNPANIQKFKMMEPSKRDRIINAAMHEFSYGYRKATTDAIVQKAGISKGLLFHYFGSKEQLYAFLVNYAMDTMKADYFSMMNIEQRDILENLWQMALLKRDISHRHPAIYDFVNSIYAHRMDIPRTEIAEIAAQKRDDVLIGFYDRCDIGLFREDINPKKAIDLIWWALDGFCEAEDIRGKDYEHFLEELRNYLDTFRQCFYKEA